MQDDFPLYLWDRLISQTEISINLLRQSNATPTVSIYACLSGPFDYNKMPHVPMGCTTQIHKKTDKRETRTYYSVKGCYLSTYAEQYRTHVCKINITRSKQLTDMAQISHNNSMNPTSTHVDKVMHAIANCVKAIKVVGHSISKIEMRQLKQLVELAQ